MSVQLNTQLCKNSPESEDAMEFGDNRVKLMMHFLRGQRFGLKLNGVVRLLSAAAAGAKR